MVYRNKVYDVSGWHEVRAACFAFARRGGPGGLSPGLSSSCRALSFVVFFPATSIVLFLHACKLK